MGEPPLPPNGPSGPIDLNAVHASMPQGLAVVSADGVFLEANDHVLTMLGRTRDEVVGRSVLDFLHPDDLW